MRERRRDAPCCCENADRAHPPPRLILVGYEGVTLIAVSGIDMAVWDALAKAAGMPLAVLLGGTLGLVLAYNSTGLWLTDVATLAQEAEELVAEGGF